jgi:predicted NUDIX family phosphoesterase
MSKMDERIIVVPRNAVFSPNSLEFQGTETRPEIVDKLNKNIDSNFGVMRRGNAEENEDFKQPIPYAVIRKGNEVFLYKRLAGGGEGRLHEKLSIGVGGHMNYDSSDFEASLLTNLNRELDEELEITETSDSKRKVTTIGFINDDLDPVGRVHIGILIVIDFADDINICVRETDQLEGEFVKLEELKKEEVYGRLESWSKIVVDTLSD